MQNKKWESKVKSLLHSLDIDSGSNIDEIKKFADSKFELNKKLKNIFSSYTKDEKKNDFNSDEMFDEFDTTDPEFEDMLGKFFAEMNKQEDKFNLDPLTEAVLMWFQELLIINKGQFKIVKDEDGTINILFNSDVIIENGKRISITDELTEEMNKLDKKSLVKKEIPKKTVTKPASKKATVAKKTTTKRTISKNDTGTGKTTQTKKTTKNKNTK